MRQYFCVQRELLERAIDVAISKEKYKQANKKVCRQLGPVSLEIIADLVTKLDIESLSEHLTVDRFMMLDAAREKAKETFRAYRRAKARVQEYYKAYRKAKVLFQNFVRQNWFMLIRFASRAIGNVWDLSLLTVPVPPTTVPADELVMNNVLYVRRQGGAWFGSPA